MKKSDQKLNQLRKQIRNIDLKLLQNISARQKLAQKIAKVKLNLDLPVKDYVVEKEVIEFYKKEGLRNHIGSELSHSIAQMLISSSVDIQNRVHKSSAKKSLAKNKKVVGIIGGQGLMGQWFAKFFKSEGYHVLICDKSRTTRGLTGSKVDLQQIYACDIIVISVPISKSSKVIESLIESNTKALIIDICSLKSPIIKSIDKAKKHNLKFVSIHPMFGPFVTSLNGRNIIICKTANSKIENSVKKIFSHTSARIIEIPIKDHDAYMAFVLGLSHLVNLIFVESLVQSKISFAKLKQVSSTTFNKQLQVALDVIHENPQLYYEIQSSNDYKQELMRCIEQSIHRYKTSIFNASNSKFVELMKDGRSYLA
jgi:chorismate mutase/prephenate dehydrogenase